MEKDDNILEADKKKSPSYRKSYAFEINELNDELEKIRLNIQRLKVIEKMILEKLKKG